MKEAGRYFPFLGLVILLVGLIGRAVNPSPYLLIALPATAVLWGLYAVFNKEELRAMAQSRTARYGAGSTLAVILVLGMLIFISIMTERHNLRYDLTAGGRYSLAPQTIKILNNLDKDVRVTGFFQDAAPDGYQAEDLLKQYARISKRFEYELIDPDLKPSIAKAAGITQYGSVVVMCRDERETITHLNEEKLTNVLLRVTRPGKKKIYFLTGHGERRLDDGEKDGYKQADELLKRQNYRVEPLLLLRAKEVPQDAAVLVIAGPVKDLEEFELEALARYLERGGHVLFLVDPEPVDRLAAWLGNYGVILAEDMVVDKMSRLFGGDYLTPIVVDYFPHPITSDFMGLASFFPLARSVNVPNDMPAGVETQVLMRSSRDSWAETDLEELTQGRASPDPEKDLAGPTPLAVVGSIESDKAAKTDMSPDETPETESTDRSEAKSNKEQTITGRYVVIGDSDFAANASLGLQINSDLFLSTIAWLAEEDDLVSIRAKNEDMQPLTLSMAQGRILFWLPVVMMPLAVLILGLMVLMHRRKQG